MNNQEKCTVILTGKFNPGGKDTEEFAEYSRRSNANGEAHGGEVKAVYIVEENLGNGSAPHVVFVVDYPSREMAVQTFTSDEYKSIIPLREVAFEEVNILITSLKA